MKLPGVLGLIMGLLIAASSAAHAFLGWPAQAGALAKIDAPSDLRHTLQAGWHFGSLAMLACGLIVAGSAWQTLRNRPWSRIPVAAVAALYVAFGVYGLTLGGWSPHFCGFIVVGLLASVLLWARSPANST